MVGPFSRSQRRTRTRADHRWATLRRTARAFGVLVFSAAAGACRGGDEATGPADAPVDAALLGTYALVALNERPLPAAFLLAPPPSHHVVEGTLTLRGDRTFVQTEVTRFYRADGSAVPGSEGTSTAEGRVTGRGAALTFSQDWGNALGRQTVGTATVTGTRLVYTDRFISSDVYTYEKR
jgi:hypothetical protein